MNIFECPYCGQEKNHIANVDEFCSCRFCGFKSAIVHGNDGKLLIVDRRMPYLQRRCKELTAKMPDVTVIVDRRIAQDIFDNSDRRLCVEAVPE